MGAGPSCARALRPAPRLITIRNVSFPQKDLPVGRPRDAARESQILEAVLGLLDDVGYEGVTFEEVARRAGASKATLYRRWKDKTAMIVAAVKAGPASGVPATIDTGTLRGDLLALLARLEASLRASDGQTSLVLLLASFRDPELCHHLEEDAGPTGARLPASVLEAAVARGELPPGASPFAFEETAGAALLIRRLGGLRSDASYREQLVDAVLLPALRNGPATDMPGIFSGRPETRQETP